MAKKYEYNENFEREEKKRKKRNRKLMVFATFLLIVFLLVFFALSGNGRGGLTGNIIKSVIGADEKKINSEDLPQIIANLGSLNENLSIKGKVGQIEIKVNMADSFFYVGNSKFDLTRLKKRDIIIKNYNGKLSFNGQNILNLNGKAAEVSINGVSLTPESGDSMKVKFNDEIGYSSLKIDGIFLDSISYITSGIIKLNREKMTLNIYNERVEIDDFQGNLNIEKNQFKFDGHVMKLNVVGKTEVSIVKKNK